MAKFFLLLLLGAGLVQTHALQADAQANPIRKIVTLLQEMSKDIADQGEKEQELYDKFMCFCESTTADLQSSSEESSAQISDLGNKLEEGKAEKAQLDQELKEHKADREGATQDLAKATSLRTKEAEEYAGLKADSEANIAALSSAIPAIEKGMGGAALMQLPKAAQLKKLVESSTSIIEIDRERVISFLSGKSDDTEAGDYAPASGQIVGILKQMKDQMESSLSEATAEETSGAAAFENLKAAKNSEIAAASDSIESKGSRSGTLAVENVQNQDGLDDAEQELADATKYLANLKVICEEKTKEWTARRGMRAQEVSAISEAISILNDDDALDVFKKAVPSAALLDTSTSGKKGAGFLQVRKSPKNAMMKKAQAIVAKAAFMHDSSQLNLLEFTMKTMMKKQEPGADDFGTVSGIIDDMIAVLEDEGKSDEKHKEYCQVELHDTEEEQAKVQDAADTVASRISELKDAAQTLTDDVTMLEEEIKKLDASVALATISRKKEHSEYTQALTLNEAALQLIGKAKNRLQKFYNPALYKAPPKKELSMEDAIYTRSGGTLEAAAPALVQINAHKKGKVAPPVAPETWGAYQSAGGKSGGVMGLMDMLSGDLQADQAQAKHDEEMAQKEYDDLMVDSKTSRQNNAKSIVDKEASRAEVDASLEKEKEGQATTQAELENIHTRLGDLHSSCDFIMGNFDLRRTARASEIESLKNAKAVLAGANFSG